MSFFCPLLFVAGVITAARRLSQAPLKSSVPRRMSQQPMASATRAAREESLDMARAVRSGWPAESVRTPAVRDCTAGEIAEGSRLEVMIARRRRIDSA